MLQKYKLFFPVLLITLSSCHVKNDFNSNSELKAFSDFEIVTSHTILWKDLLNQEYEQYVVFIYSETCSHCHEIQDEIIAFAQDNIHKIYFIDTRNDQDVSIIKDIEPTYYATDIKDIGILGTPSLLEISEATLTANIAGKENILTYLNDMHQMN